PLRAARPQALGARPPKVRLGLVRCRGWPSNDICRNKTKIGLAGMVAGSFTFADGRSKVGEQFQMPLLYRQSGGRDWFQRRARAVGSKSRIERDCLLVHPPPIATIV